MVYLLSFLFIIENHLFSYSSNPKDFVNELVNEAIEKLSDKSLTDEKKTNFIEEIALENADINALATYIVNLENLQAKRIFLIIKNL